MKRTFRYLRILLSAFCGILCLLLIALWVMSYQRQINLVNYDGLYAGDREGQCFEFRSLHGVIGVLIGLGENPAMKYRIPEASFKFRDFRSKSELGYWHLDLPLWFVVIATATFAYLPWLAWPKQFSLRTLLIATTAVAVSLGFIVWMARR